MGEYGRSLYLDVYREEDDPQAIDFIYRSVEDPLGKVLYKFDVALVRKVEMESVIESSVE